jgi:signal transduction histidine kinase
LKSLSLHRVIIFGIVGIEVVTALVFLAAFSFHAGREADRHANESIGWAQRIVQGEMALFFQQMEAVTELTERLSRDDLLDFKDQNTLERYFFEALKATPRLTGIYHGAADGSFVFVTREAPDLEPGQTFTRVIDTSGGVRVERTRIRDADYMLRTARTVPDGEYDPRSRPWYIGAVETDKTVYSDPYLFFTAGKPGITISRRIGGAGGTTVRGVAGVDLSLGGLSDFVSELRISDGGKVFITDAEGRVIALPDIARTGTDTGGALPTLEGGADPVLAAGFEALKADWGPNWLDRLASENARFQFRHDGDTYVGAVTLTRSDQVDWLIGAYAPLRDYLGWLDGVQTTTIWLTALLAAMGILGGWFLSNTVRRRLRRIESSAERFLSDEDAFDYDTSSFSELRATEKALAGMADEIADREADLRAVNEKLAAIMRAVDRMPIGIAVLRYGGEISYVNALAAVVLELTGDGTERADTAWVQRLEARARTLNGEPEAGWLTAALKERRSWRAELPCAPAISDDDAPATRFQIIAAPIGVAAENGWALALEDVTERKAMEADLSRARDAAEEASRAKSMFLANMSHELRTPLNSILGFGELMRQEAFGPVGSDRYREYIELILSSGGALLEILSNLLSLTAIESGKLSLSVRDADLSAIVREAVALHGREVEGRAMTIRVDAPDSAPFRADVTKLRQAIGNLIQNAARYADGATRLHVQIVAEADRLVLSIDDDGVGLPPERMETVLEPFRRSESDSTLAAPDGVGLGLPIAKAMVELHGGTFALQVGDTGKGLRAVLTLPLAPDTEAPGPPES